MRDNDDYCHWDNVNNGDGDEHDVDIRIEDTVITAGPDNIEPKVLLNHCKKR